MAGLSSRLPHIEEDVNQPTPAYVHCRLECMQFREAEMPSRRRCWGGRGLGRHGYRLFPDCMITRFDETFGQEDIRWLPGFGGCLCTAGSRSSGIGRISLIPVLLYLRQAGASLLG